MGIVVEVIGQLENFHITREDLEVVMVVVKVIVSLFW